MLATFAFSRGITRPLLLAAFFASGFAALIYQTIWQRMLTLFSGADVYSITIIVAAFMAGLGFGSLAGGHFADRLSSRGRLRTFAACEAAVAAFALASTTVYYDVLYLRFGASAWSRSSIAAIVFGVTLAPTFLMGMSMPLLSKFPIGERDVPATWVARLYGWNTLGAACGSLVTVTWMLRSFDLRVTLQIGAGVSAVCAAMALVASGGTRIVPGTRFPTGLTSAVPPTRFSFRTWLLLYALSGFIALSLEIVWFRVMGVMLKSNALTFGYLLTFYLAGLGLGSLLAHQPQFRRLDAPRAFLVLQAGIPLWAAASFTLLVAIAYLGWARPLSDYLARPEPLGSPGVFALLCVWLALVLIVPCTLMMGLSFGLLQRAVQTDSSFVGRRVGWLQTANILGATAGAILTGVLFLDWFGSAGTFRALAVCGVVFVALSPHSRTARNRLARGLPTAAVLVLVALMPNEGRFWAALHGSHSDRVIVGEDGSGLVVLRQDTDNTKVFLGGISQSWLPYHGIHTALGALPALLHPRPEEVAVIGLGSGDTLFAIGARRETRNMDSIEIMAPQLRALQRLAGRTNDPALEMLLTDPRIRHEVADARTFLRRGDARYDLVEADALLPRIASAGNLYSVEYFGLLRRCLNPGGFAVSWIPTERTFDSFLATFPYALRLDSIAIGSASPIAFSRTLLNARMRDPFTSRYYSAGGVDLASTLAPYLEAVPKMFGPSSDRSGLIDLNHDLFPKDEFGIRQRSPALVK